MKISQAFHEKLLAGIKVWGDWRHKGPTTESVTLEMLPDQAEKYAFCECLPALKLDTLIRNHNNSFTHKRRAVELVLPVLLHRLGNANTLLDQLNQLDRPWFGRHPDVRKARHWIRLLIHQLDGTIRRARPYHPCPAISRQGA